ncbi:glycosyltransferase family 2 protein [Polynucleobacter nymphae]|uniref:glycosyltransferase family 2 protein n=1 Tax=Polynucleobacter nymphae TaxID=2081043 RepID=UPI001C0B8888|nr:glycosyltransferase family 2 protein [Polynucleobacter nymphae]MBU3607779.1 glycosyltransferase [Polynucleobacter nymphae]
MNKLKARFNYIITIHNKEDLIIEVISSVLMCCRGDSRVYAVLDGCTDQTEALIDSYMEKFRGLPITKVYESDVHELLSINAGLKAASHEGYGFNIVLQDDVVLADFNLEEKIQRLYEESQIKLGYLSLRLGANLESNILETETYIPLCDYVENAYGHGLPEATVLLPDCFVSRDIPIKSPVCIPFELIRNVGFLESRLAPYAHDDTDYAIRCMAAGYTNGVFALRFYSDPKWGGTRINPHPHIANIQKRNIDLIRLWHADAIKKILNTNRANVRFDDGHFVSEADKRHANKAWQENQRKLLENSSSSTNKIMALVNYFRCLGKKL